MRRISSASGMPAETSFTGDSSSSSSAAAPLADADSSTASSEQAAHSAIPAASSPEPGPGGPHARIRRGPRRGVDLITGPEGHVQGFSISPVAQVYSLVDHILASPSLVRLPIDERYALAGKVAAVPAEHARLVERLASCMATSMTESGALNALYLLELCSDLVPCFKEAVPEGRMAKAAELSAHGRLQAAILRGQRPEEWEESAELQPQPPSLVWLAPEQLKRRGVLHESGRAVGDASKFVGGTALGGVGLVTDKLGITSHAGELLSGTAEEAVDLVGDGVSAIIDAVDEGLDGTAKDVTDKGVLNAVKDSMHDAADIMGGFVSSAVDGIAGGVKETLDWMTSGAGAKQHKVAIVVAELFGDERSIGLRIEDRTVTRLTRPEAEGLGWRVGDRIVAIGKGVVTSQEDVLTAISATKEALRTQGTPIQFIVERPGGGPAAAAVADPRTGRLVFIDERPARVKDVDADTGMMTVQFEDDDTIVAVPSKQ